MSQQTDEALRILENATATISTNLEGHTKMQQCLQLLKNHIQNLEQPVVKKVKKSKKTNGVTPSVPEVSTVQ